MKPPSVAFGIKPRTLVLRATRKAFWKSGIARTAFASLRSALFTDLHAPLEVENANALDEVASDHPVAVAR